MNIEFLTVDDAKVALATRHIDDVVVAASHLGASMGRGQIYPGSNVWIEDIVHLGGAHTYIHAYCVDERKKRIPLLCDGEPPHTVQFTEWLLRAFW